VTWRPLPDDDDDELRRRTALVDKLLNWTLAVVVLTAVLQVGDWIWR
jgi:hypothetical protein